MESYPALSGFASWSDLARKSDQAAKAFRMTDATATPWLAQAPMNISAWREQCKTSVVNAHDSEAPIVGSRILRTHFSLWCCGSKDNGQGLCIFDVKLDQDFGVDLEL